MARKTTTTRRSRSDGLDAPTRDALSRFLRDLRSLQNESAKTHRFSGLVSELFPGTAAPTLLAQGIEKIVRVETTGGEKARRRIDAYHGNLIFEFENSLKATESVALGQLREQAAGIWAEEKPPYRPLLCVAADGIVWKVFRPTFVADASSPPTSGQIDLVHLRTLVLTEESLREFWFWLVSAFFGGHDQNPTAERFKNDFGVASPAFVDAMDALAAAWQVARDLPEPRVAFDNWQRYLAFTYGQIGDESRRDELEDLFLKHTYLATTARFLVWGALSGGKFDGSLRDEARSILAGTFFESHGVENLAEEDFFQWARRPEAERILAPVWERMLAQVLTYSLDRLDEDVLKGVYQELVDPRDRRQLGEYYTPEWLCERIVEELLPAGGWVSVLDPTCGSGSFLRASIAHLLKNNPNGGGRLRAVLDHVVGIDIHPLAVIIARATYVLAISHLIRQAKRPIQIPVYLADALFLPKEITQPGVTKPGQKSRFAQPRLDEPPGFVIRFGGDRAVSIPEQLVRDPEFFDSAITAAAKVAADLAAGSKETEKSFQVYLRRTVPVLANHGDFDAMVTALWRFTDELADLIVKRKNSIWAFVIRNAYRPAMLRGRFDFVLGNPPWLSYRNISDPEYQAEVKRRAVEEYQIAPPTQKLITQMELATVFLVHTLSTFGRPGARLAFVMPRSVLSADQHIKFRDGSYSAPVRLDSYWDLFGVSPLFNVPACVFFATHARNTEYRSLPMLEMEGKLLLRDASFSEAEPFLRETSHTAKLVHLGGRTAYSTTAKSTAPAAASPYAKAFRQGATIVPRSFYFVRVKGLSGQVDRERVYWAETDPEQAEDAKPPYDDVRLSGQVEGRFLFCTALSKHVLPFVLVGPPTVFLPIEEDGDSLRVLASKDLRAAGYREAAKWMATAERVWAEKRGGKAARQSVYQRLDYSRELSHQKLVGRYLVVYNAAGTNLCATAVDRHALPEPFVVDHKLYWAPCRSRSESDYLAAILNAPAINEIIKPFQSMGLIGERDIHKKVLEAPIPLFDDEKAEHAKLAALGAEARKVVAKTIRDPNLPASLARRRAFVREAIGDTIEGIDAIVKRILGL